MCAPIGASAVIGPAAPGPRLPARGGRSCRDPLAAPPGPRTLLPPRQRTGLCTCSPEEPRGFATPVALCRCPAGNEPISHADLTPTPLSSSGSPTQWARTLHGKGQPQQLDLASAPANQAQGRLEGTAQQADTSAQHPPGQGTRPRQELPHCPRTSLRHPSDIPRLFCDSVSQSWLCVCQCSLLSKVAPATEGPSCTARAECGLVTVPAELCLSAVNL